jgi:hypothetical protein
MTDNYYTESCSLPDTERPQNSTPVELRQRTSLCSLPDSLTGMELSNTLCCNKSSLSLCVG